VDAAAEKLEKELAKVLDDEKAILDGVKLRTGYQPKDEVAKNQ
jgi:hypothetical protein